MQNVKQEYSVLTSIKEVTMDIFIRCDCHKDYKAIVLTGDPPDDELYLAWLEIKSQHQENIKDAQANRNISAVHDIAVFELKKKAVECLLTVLDEIYSEEIIEQLREEDYDYPFTPESYKTDMDRVRAELASEGLPIYDYRQKLQAVAEEGIRPDEDRYYKFIAVLQKQFGICTGKSPINAAKELTVYEFGLFYHQFIQQVKNTPHGQ